MKKSLLATIILYCSMTGLFGQPISMQGLPITDPGSLAGSVAATAAYGASMPIDGANLIKVGDYASSYNKRSMYYMGGLINRTIDNRITDANRRLDRLTRENSVLEKYKFWSKQTLNEQLLLQVENQLQVVEDELSKKHMITIYGEKLNLLQNTMLTVTRIHKTLDVIEKKIRNSDHKARIFRMLKR